MTDSYAEAPFHYLPVVERSGAAPLLTIVNSSGGVLGGDDLGMEIEVGAGADLAVRTQAATKIYRSRGGAARSVSRFRLAEGALIDYFPDELIPFAGSDYAQVTQVEIAPRAVMLFAEIVTAGRIERGERFLFRRLVLDLACSAGEILLLRDRADIRPDEHRFASPATLGDAMIWGSLFLLTRTPLDGSLIEQIDARLCSVGGHWGGATAAPIGLFGRIIGSSLDAVRRALEEAADVARERIDEIRGEE